MVSIVHKHTRHFEKRSMIWGLTVAHAYNLIMCMYIVYSLIKFLHLFLTLGRYSKQYL